MRENGGLLLAFLFGLIVVSASLGYGAATSWAQQTTSQNRTKQGTLGGKITNSEALSQTHSSDQRQVLYRPCRHTPEDRNSDLCAQWEAAEAAGDAALWAMIGTVVATLGTMGLYIQISLTRRAVKDTGEATEAMRGANKIAEHAQRPWVDIELLVHSFENAENHIFFEYSVQLKNIGKSIAEGIWHFSHADFFGRNQSAEVKKWRDQWWHDAHAKGPSSFAIMPGETYSFGGGAIARSKDTIPWFGEPDNRLVGAGVIVSVVYKVPGQPSIEDYKRTERFIRFAPTQDDRMYGLWVLEHDLRKVSPEEIGVYKTRSTTTT